MTAYIAPLCESSTIVRDAIMSLEGSVEIEECAGDTGTWHDNIIATVPVFPRLPFTVYLRILIVLARPTRNAWLE